MRQQIESNNAREQKLEIAVPRFVTKEHQALLCGADDGDVGGDGADPCAAFGEYAARQRQQRMACPNPWPGGISSFGSFSEKTVFLFLTSSTHFASCDKRASVSRLASASQSRTKAPGAPSLNSLTR